MGDWINDKMKKPAVTAVSAVLAVAAMGGHIPSVLAGDDTERVKGVVRTVIQEEYEAQIEGLEPVKQFVHRLDREHQDCIEVKRDRGLTIADSEIVCTLRSLEEIAIRGLR